MNSFNSFNNTIDDRTANQHIVVDKPGVWNSQDSYRFHCELTNYTKLEKGLLSINHQYLDNRDIHLIELLENKFKHEIENNNIYSFNEFQKSDIVHYLEHDNESSPEKDCLSLFKLLCNLQIATKNKFTMRQLNNKHINTRSRWSVPLKNLNEIGYFVKNQAPKGMRPTPEELVEMTIKRSKKTNMESKNTTIVKALQKYAVNKQLYWCDQTNGVPLLEGSTLLANTISDYSEADRWICAMISKHGKVMVSYMDKCVVNLVNSYLCDKHESMDTTTIPTFVMHETPPPKIAELLDQHVKELVEISKTKSLKSLTDKSKLSSANVSPVSLTSSRFESVPGKSNKRIRGNSNKKTGQNSRNRTTLKKQIITFSPKKSSVYALVDNSSELTSELNPEMSKRMTNFGNQIMQYAAIETANKSPVMLSKQIGYRASAPALTTAMSTASTSTSASALVPAPSPAPAFNLQRKEFPLICAQYTPPVKSFKKLEDHKIVMPKFATSHERYYNGNQPLAMPHSCFINPEVGYINSSNMHPYLQQMQQMQMQQRPTGHAFFMSTQVFMPPPGMPGLNPDNYPNHNQVYQGRYEDPKY